MRPSRSTYCLPAVARNPIFNLPPEEVSFKGLDHDAPHHPLFLSSIYTSTLVRTPNTPTNNRGQEKIKMILKTAKRVGIDRRDLLPSFKTKMERNDPGSEFEKVERQDGRSITTPLHSVMKNREATNESLRLLCSAWSPILHITSKENLYGGYLWRLVWQGI